MGGCSEELPLSCLRRILLCVEVFSVPDLVDYVLASQDSVGVYEPWSEGSHQSRISAHTMTLDYQMDILFTL